MNDFTYTMSAGKLPAALTGGEYIWATSEDARNRALSLLLLGSIAGKYGGTVGINQDTHAICVDVPDKEKLGCAQEIEERIGATLN